MTNDNESLEAQAVAWVIRLRDAGAEDWEEFTNWLEADPANGAAYEEAALVDAEVEALPRAPARPVVPDVPTEAPARRSWTSRRAVLGWGIAAALVGTIGLSTLRSGDSLYAVATRAGERRSVDLADGSRIDLNGETRLMLDRDNPRFARLDQGEALFTVAHDESRPFRVESGEAELIDLGTVFNVERDADGIEVQVAEGAVRYNDGEERVDLRAGMTVRKVRGGHAQLGARGAEAIQGWREGRLTYSNASFAEVAQDLSRNLGLDVAADASVAQRRFSGVILLDRDPQLVLRRAAALLEVNARQQGDGWMLSSGGRETP
jgi:transmembrane sensor